VKAKSSRPTPVSTAGQRNQKGKHLMANIDRSVQRSETKAYLVGGGIASLASAAYLIRDGGLKGSNICIFEETALLGGSLDGSGSPDHGYVIRGGRMFTYEAYTCTFDLLSFIPSLTDPAKTSATRFMNSTTSTFRIPTHGWCAAAKKSTSPTWDFPIRTDST
jgi:myosin-crossreactive antigen